MLIEKYIYYNCGYAPLLHVVAGVVVTTPVIAHDQLDSSTSFAVTAGRLSLIDMLR